VLGASAQAVARQFLAESVLVCLIATVLGLLLAWLVLPLFSDLVQRRFDQMFSAGALAAALLFGVLLGVAAGAWPTWSALRVRATAALAGRNGSETARGLWLRRSLTALQFAAAMGLTGTTLAVAWQTHYASTLSPGFDPRPLLTLPAGNDMRDPRMRAFRDEVLRLPGVAGVAEAHPYHLQQQHHLLRREGGQATDLNLYAVSPEFFDVYGLKPVAGRLYNPALDRVKETDRVVINASAARKLGFASPQDAVGKMVGGTGGDDRQMQVVGVAPDIRHRSAREGEQPSVFYLRDQVRILTIRCSGDPVAVKHAIEAIWPRHFPNEPVDVLHMDKFIVDQFYADDLRLAKLLAASSVIATAIAAFGIYVLAAYSVQRREREIVLRKLYGAGSAAVGSLVLREFALLVGAGALVGLPLAGRRHAALPGRLHGTGADRRLDRRGGAAAGLRGDAGFDPAPHAGRGADPAGAGADGSESAGLLDGGQRDLEHQAGVRRDRGWPAGAVAHARRDQRVRLPPTFMPARPGRNRR
jgi:putative ABC transport system permease protein